MCAPAQGRLFGLQVFGYDCLLCGTTITIRFLAGRRLQTVVLYIGQVMTSSTSFSSPGSAS
ncbi:hypothetical protein CALCODRAFT_495574 [Calocera cornea HHB12733]|uniref:Uncharacterized protein n=1 Tax=Calocera cornea HHB12733 TaxID=1353952 RepID=A0A165GD45_9BASI|nr:hypothetical protein CALCODRAFT_495574 [Calocera cornea HHB12733]